MREVYSLSLYGKLCMLCQLLVGVALGRPCHSILLRFQQNQNYFKLIFIPIRAMQQLLCVNYVDKIMCYLLIARQRERGRVCAEVDLHHHVMSACACVGVCVCACWVRVLAAYVASVCLCSLSKSVCTIFFGGSGSELGVRGRVIVPFLTLRTFSDTRMMWNSLS